ncbi:hypothetical protein Suden_0122 [Sulfurimonas denitrificans DSM 1251]|uniref:Uncharacterized protein n=1 Tax=Sulfurimonas denitrificans (strain ATCC 33889 / DSM 1251) TaxID=326298 RepID=Q30UC8_SULDN|nr:hypothetical protein [Sulfurimonas denitrificans]ABB43403.1 hypothetical protein Suden_0122 [Sulfurimonas denitrificans DSM 1251]MDD3442247.1 hypothetical protein [Sulfurimonas denitrificans]
MARDQTIFSEICIALSIIDARDTDFSFIENVTKKDEEIYLKELEKRSLLKNGALSIEALKQSGLIIRNYLVGCGFTPKKIIWTGKDNIAGVVSVAKDLEILNFRISVKENADVFINGSPLTVFEDLPKGLFGQKKRGEDWFIKTAKDEIERYYALCRKHLSVHDDFSAIDKFYGNRDKAYKKEFSKKVALLHSEKNNEILESYQIMCNKVSQISSEIFNQNLLKFKTAYTSSVSLQPIFHYFFKINGIKYIIAGTEKNKPFASLLENSTSWTKQYSFLDIIASPKEAGQPEVLLRFIFKDKKTNEQFEIPLKIEIRWSHGKFCGNPEAKVYKQWSYMELPWSENL